MPIWTPAAFTHCNSFSCSHVAFKTYLLIYVCKNVFKSQSQREASTVWINQKTHCLFSLSQTVSLNIESASGRDLLMCNAFTFPTFLWPENIFSPKILSPFSLQLLFSLSPLLYLLLFFTTFLFFFYVSFVTWKLWADVFRVLRCELCAISILLPFLYTFLPSENMRVSHNVLLVCVWAFGPSLCLSQASVSLINTNHLN